jgi:serine/threonine protein kinase
MKPSNILIVTGDTGNPVPKISDFGLSKDLDKYTKSTCTVHGTEEYRSPESWKTEPKFSHNEKSDIFSTGLVGYFIFYKSHPFGDDPPDIVVNVKDEKLKRQELKDHFHEHIFSLMLSRDPKERPTIDWILEHPLFWDQLMDVDFLGAILHYGQKRDHVKKSINYRHVTVIGPGSVSDETWVEMLGSDAQDFPHFLTNGKKDYYYQKSRQSVTVVFSLLRFVRNYYIHFNELTPRQKKILRGSKEAFFHHMTKELFPNLVPAVYLALIKNHPEVHDLDDTRKFFPRIRV